MPSFTSDICFATLVPDSGVENCDEEFRTLHRDRKMLARSLREMSNQYPKFKSNDYGTNGRSKLEQVSSRFETSLRISTEIDRVNQVWWLTLVLWKIQRKIKPKISLLRKTFPPSSVTISNDVRLDVRVLNVSRAWTLIKTRFFRGRRRTRLVCWKSWSLYVSRVLSSKVWSHRAH